MEKVAPISKRPSCILWSEIEKWMPKSVLLRFGKLPEGWRLLPVSAFASQLENKEKVKPEGEYRMAGVRWYGEGVFHRETVVGKEQSANYLYPLKPGTIIYNRLFAWKESFAVVPEYFNGYYVSNEFPQFEIDPAIALPKYIYLLFNTKKIINAVNAASIGSAAISRNRFKESDFLRFKVPIPPLPIQQKIVAYWDAAQAEIESATKSIQRIEQNLEVNLLYKLGINVPTVVPKVVPFSITFSQNERWDTFFFRKDFISLEEQIASTVHIKLGDALHFLSRSWKEKDFEGDEFDYIEISSVNKVDGITSTRKAKVKEAPSRATTLVKEGDIIISTTRPYLGAFAIVDKQYDGSVCSSGFALADSVKTSEIIKEFVLFFLKSPAGLKQVERRMSGGSYPAIVQSELEKVLLPLPSLEMQRIVLNEYQAGIADIKRLHQESDKRKDEMLSQVEKMILGTLSAEAH